MAGQAKEQPTGLPKLELKKLRSTEIGISTPSCVFPCNNISIITHESVQRRWGGRPSEPIEYSVVDEQGNIIEDFTPLARNRWEHDEFHRYWKGKDCLIHDEATPDQLQYIHQTKKIWAHEFPPHMRNDINALIRQSGSIDSVVMDLNDEMNPSSTLRGDRNISVIDDGKYVIITDGNRKYISYITKNQAGTTFPSPANWIRIDANTPVDKVPADLAQFIYLATSETTARLVNCTEKYLVRASEDSLCVFTRDQTTNEPIYSDKRTGVEKNCCADPGNPQVIYYCKADGTDIVKLDLGNDPNTWQSITVHLPKKYNNISNLQIDPTGNFFLFNSENNLVVLLKDTLEEVAVVPDLKNVHIAKNGQIKGFDTNNSFVIQDSNLKDLAREVEKRRAAAILQKVEVRDVFKQASAQDAAAVRSRAERYAHLNEQKKVLESQFTVQLQQARTIEEVEKITAELERVRREELIIKGELSRDAAEYMTEGIAASLKNKTTQLTQAKAVELLTRSNRKVMGSLSLTTASEVKRDLDELERLSGYLDSSTTGEVGKLKERYQEVSTKLFREQTELVQTQINDMVAAVEQKLMAMVSRDQFQDFRDYDYPIVRESIAAITRECPAEVTEVHRAALEAQKRLFEIAQREEKRFAVEYATKREAAATRIDTAAALARSEIISFIERIRERGFKTRAQAEAYVEKSNTYKMIQDEIASLTQLDPNEAAKLRRSLKVLMANTLGEIDRSGKIKTAETGQQLVPFGKTFFPRWEHKLKEKPQRQVTLTFEPVANQAVPSEEILGDVSLSVSEKGEKKKVRLFEDYPDENNYRLGFRTIGGVNIEPSYMKASRFKEVQRMYIDWTRGENGTIRKQYDALVKKLEDHFAKQPKFKTPDTKAKWWKGNEGQRWQKERDPLVKEWTEFLQKNPINIFKRIDAVKDAPEAKNGNGIGNVPIWRNHWTRDPDTEAFLEQLAIEASGQLERQEGMINMEGHAGTGKDVALDIFCAETNRPLFATDCSKWTTEPELISDITLQVKDGASYVVDVPSSVLLGIQTPGAVVYFNEFNSMPLPSQILLHSLMSEKRSLTLKLKSGKVVRVDPTVIIAGSQNPDYPGTFDPQMATVSRMVTLRRNYPPLYLERKKAGEKRYNYCEALRMAREVDSLADLTDDPNMEENEFVQLWNHYINGEDNGADEPTPRQKYDMEVLLGLQVYADKLRGEFVKIVEKSTDQYTSLPVTLPVTGRELRRCATYLSKQISDDDIKKYQPDELVRYLLERYFVNNFHKQTDRDQILKAWTQADWKYARIPSKAGTKAKK